MLPLGQRMESSSCSYRFVVQGMGPTSGCAAQLGLADPLGQPLQFIQIETAQVPQAQLLQVSRSVPSEVQAGKLEQRLRRRGDEGALAWAHLNRTIAEEHCDLEVTKLVDTEGRLPPAGSHRGDTGGHRHHLRDQTVVSQGGLQADTRAAHHAVSDDERVRLDLLERHRRGVEYVAQTCAIRLRKPTPSVAAQPSEETAKAKLQSPMAGVAPPAAHRQVQSLDSCSPEVGNWSVAMPDLLVRAGPQRAGEVGFGLGNCLFRVSSACQPSGDR